MNKYRKMTLIYCFLITLFFTGCGNSVEKEDTLTDELEQAVTLEPVEESDPQPEETKDEVSEEIVEKIIWDDLDGNGEQEYFMLSNEETGTLSLYFNNELIYQYKEKDLRIAEINEKEFIDLDDDGEEEIFVSFFPRVNSMPLVEWFALKKVENGWELMEMYHQNGDMTQNEFPISVVMKTKDFELSITCEGCEKEIVYWSCVKI